MQVRQMTATILYIQGRTLPILTLEMLYSDSLQSFMYYVCARTSMHVCVQMLVVVPFLISEFLNLILL